MEVGIAQAFGGQTVEGRRGDIRSEAAQLGESDVVENDDDDIRRTRRSSPRLRPTRCRFVEVAPDHAAKRFIPHCLTPFRAISRLMCRRPPRSWVFAGDRAGAFTYSTGSVRVSGQLGVAEATHQVVVDQPGGLHVRITDGRSDESEATGAQIGAQSVRGRGRSRELLDPTPLFTLGVPRRTTTCRRRTNPSPFGRRGKAPHCAPWIRPWPDCG